MSKALTGFQKSQQALIKRQSEADKKAVELPKSLDPDFPYAVESAAPGFGRIPAELTPVKNL